MFSTLFTQWESAPMVVLQCPCRLLPSWDDIYFSLYGLCRLVIYSSSLHVRTFFRTCKERCPYTYGKTSLHVRTFLISQENNSCLGEKARFTGVFSPRQCSRLILRFGAARPAERKRSLDISREIALLGDLLGKKH